MIFINKILSPFKHLSLLLVIIFLHSCKPFYNSVYTKPNLVDYKPSKELKKLHKKLFYISKTGFAVGHQDDTAYGIGWKQADSPETIKSDVNDVVGDFPAVYGFDISGIEYQNEYNIDTVPFVTMRKLMIDAYSKGGIITVSWHTNNPVTDGNSWDKTSAVADILNTPEFTLKYDQWLKLVADYLKTITYKGKQIPIVFRPLHEMNGSWFWWGNPNCSPEDYKLLWQKTVSSLRDQHQLHNLIYVYSPNRLEPKDNYLDYYPGDEFVDVLGIDIYDFKDSKAYAKSVANDLKIVKELAVKRNKLYAFTETGQEAITTKNWYTEVLYPEIKDSGIAWILFWRNYSKTHHYMPYKTHSSEQDFKKFKNLPQTLFLQDINKLKL